MVFIHEICNKLNSIQMQTIFTVVLLSATVISMVYILIDKFRK